jgi:NAD(P)-dependent dehydrogenase (short-subunit alcohol dehydrogenase family)
MRLEGKVAVITGAARGLGRAGALAFSREGAKVVLGDIVAPALDRTVAAVAEGEGEAVGVPTDVSDEEQVRWLVETADVRFGKLDIMWCNAGVTLPGAPDIPFEQRPSEDWHRQVAVNFTGVYYGAKHAVAPLRRSGGGVILITGSAGGIATPAGWSMYGAVKAGVNGLARSLAVDLGKYGIRVNAMAPTGGLGMGFFQGPGGESIDERRSRSGRRRAGFRASPPATSRSAWSTRRGSRITSSLPCFSLLTSRATCPGR